MSVWERVALGEIATSVDYGVTASATEQPLGPKFLRITDIQNGHVDWNRVPWCECDNGIAAERRLKQDDIVFARTGATTGKSFLIRDCPSNAVFASYLIRVRLGDKADARYVGHYFHTPDYWAQISASARGVAQPGVNASTLKALKIPLPPLAQQRRIAEVLDRAEALAAKRRAVLAQLDTLTQAIFLDLFGDPAKNPKGWQRVKLGDAVFSASDGPHVSPTYSDDGIPFISTRHVRAGEITWEDLKFISPEDAEIHWRKCKPEFGDILYTKGGTTGLAVAVTTNQPFALWVHVALLKPNSTKVDSTWLESMLNTEFCYRQSQELTHGIANRDLGLTRMIKMDMFLPPLTLQHEFARRVAAVKKLKTTHQASLVELDGLFAALQFRAFRGEL